MSIAKVDTSEYHEAILKTDFTGLTEGQGCAMHTTLLPLLKKMVVGLKNSLSRLQPVINQEPPDIAGWWDLTPFERAIGDMALAEGREQPQPKNNLR